MKDLILITGSVMNSNEDSIKTYTDLIRMIDSDKYEVSSPLDTMKFTGTDQERFKRAIGMLEKTKLMIAEMSTVSTGQGIEIGIASTLNIPILVIAKEGSKVSGLVKGCSSVKGVVYYKEIEDVRKQVTNFINGEDMSHKKQ